MFCLKQRGGSLALLATALLLDPLGGARAGHAQGSRSGAREKPKVMVAGLWSLPKADGPLTLAAFDSSRAVSAAVSGDTKIEGVCVHCRLALKYRADEVLKNCSACPCGYANGACLAGTESGQKSWRALLETLPKWTRLRVDYMAAGRPESGIARLAIDMRGAVLPVEGLQGPVSDQLQELRKAAGATQVEIAPAGDRLQLSFRDVWTADKELRLEKALTRLGARVAAPPDERAAR
jgi:hypothetical protein